MFYVIFCLSVSICLPTWGFVLIVPGNFFKTLYMNDLKVKGYTLLRNVLTYDDVNHALSSIKNDNKIDYSIMKQFIDTVFFPTIQNNLTTINDPHYVKFRFSNNNNSTDASTFHSDVYNHTNSKFLPIYTCLCYFDNAQMEVVPGSHIDQKLSSVSSFSRKKLLNMKQGDILVFHANLHHRGVNYNKTENRRLLQVFEVFPDKKTYNDFSSKLVIVQSYKSSIIKNFINPLLYSVSQIPFMINIITFFHYILMYNDLQYKIGLMDISPWEKKDKFVTYEPGKRVLNSVLIKENGTEDINVNVLCDEKIKTVPVSNFYLYLAVFLLLIAILSKYAIQLNVSKHKNIKHGTILSSLL